MALDRPIRSSRRVYLFAGYSWLFAASMLAIGALAVVSLASREGVASALIGAVFFGGIAAAAIWFGGRVRRAELRISPHSVVVRNPIHCHIVPSLPSRPFSRECDTARQKWHARHRRLPHRWA